MFYTKLCVAFTVLSGCLFASQAANANFPPDIQLCRVSETECIPRTATNLVRKYGATGYAPAAFPIVEPFLLKRFDISDGRSGSLSLKLNFRDVNVEGLSGVQIERAVGFDADPSTSKFEIYGYLPKIVLRGKYVADGRILILPIKGDGDANIVLQHPKFSVKFKPAIHPKDGKTYLSVDKLKVLMEPQKMEISLSNLFNGDQALGANLNQFLNDNWKDVWNELAPSIHKAIAEVIKSVLRSMFQKFAYEDLYSPQ